MPPAKQTICLNMIVRNESAVIERCLASVRNFIDHWVIVDTGSTDDTPALVQRALCDVPGTLIERPWVDFAYNRTEALEFAREKGDYLFVIDADELLVLDHDFKWPELTHDAYYLKICSGPVVYWRAQLFKPSPGLSYRSRVHEYLALPETATTDRLPGVWIDSRTDGARAAEPGTYQRDVEQLLLAHRKTPDDPRTVFYLAQSYAAAGDFEAALQFFERRVELGGWPEEVWSARFQTAEIKHQLQRDWAEVQQTYLEAYQLRPERAEPLYRIAVHYRWEGAFHLAHLFLQQAAAIPYPEQDYLFVEERLYRYLIRMALATCCYHLGDYNAGLRWCDELLQDHRRIPANIYDQLLMNRQLCVAKLTEPQSLGEDPPPRVKVFVVLTEPGIHLDCCIERLLDQKYTNFEAIFVALGPEGKTAQTIPEGDPRIRVLQPTGFGCGGEGLFSLVATNCDESDVVLLLDGECWLASDDALVRLGQHFADPECQVTYGQFQYADGDQGLAVSLPAGVTDDVLFDDWRSTFPLAFRGGILQRALRDDPSLAAVAVAPTAAIPPTAHEEHVTLARALFATAGATGIRFNPQPLCVYDADPGSPVISPPLGTFAAKFSREERSLPLISCLTVTGDRLVLLKEAIRCYCLQTYPRRELVIVTDGSPRYRRAISDYLTWLGRADIRLIQVNEADQRLGALRNVSLDAARGAIVCQWDDDDLNHPERLERQYRHLLASGAHACCFTDQLQFFYNGRSLYWSDWRVEGATPTEQLIPGTLMTHCDDRFRYPITGNYVSAGEDSVLLDQIGASATITPFSDAGYLNIYSYHGKNVFPEFHHRRIALLGSRPVEFFRAQESTLRQALRTYRLPRPYRVTMGDGLASYLKT